MDEFNGADGVAHGRSALDRHQRWARSWLFDAALPLWWQAGADRDDGGFHDRLDQSARPLDKPKRLRVQARQAFVYAEAGRLGWRGPWREACAHGLDFMLSAFRREDGLFRASVTRAGTPLDDQPDLYDQAFALFALASGYVALGRRPALLAEAEALLDALEDLLAHPEHGFEEARPRKLPLRSNPHMHLLEALLAWVEAGGSPRFRRHAEAIVTLATERLIDPRTSSIGEYYDGGWCLENGPQGALREPGHHFEWAYLLREADRILGGDRRAQSGGLVRFASRHGICDGRAVFAVDEKGRFLDASSRLWAQTERLRTMLVLPDMLPPGEGEAAALESVATIQRHLDVPVTGLWRDRIDAAGVTLDEPAPASSFYHIMTGLVPLLELAPEMAHPSFAVRSPA